MTMDFEWKAARRYAFRLLSLRNFHSAVLTRKLEAKGFPLDLCKRVIEDCIRLGFLKDEAALLSEYRRGYGPRYIAFKLRVDQNEVRDVITREMQTEKMLELLPKLGAKEKAMRTLQRKGFDFDLVMGLFRSQ